MIFPRSVIHEKRVFVVVGSIIAVTAILAASGAATQLAFAGEGLCSKCTLDISGSGTFGCVNTITYPSTISVSVTKGKAGTYSGTLTVTIDSGLTNTGTVTGGKITSTEYSLQGNPIDTTSTCGGFSPFSVSGPLGTSVPINFRGGDIDFASFTGTAKITHPT